MTQQYEIERLRAQLESAEALLEERLLQLRNRNARLAEAERLLRLWFEYREPDDRLTAYSAKVEAFLRAADSATESPSDCG